MIYAEFREKRQESFNKLPMKAAFGDKQFEEMMAEWGLTTSKDDLKKISSLGGGAYCLVKDEHLFYEWVEENDKKMKEFLSDEIQLKDALIYEFGNHECGYTMEPMNGVRTLFTDEEIQDNKLLAKVFPIAWKEYLESCG